MATDAGYLGREDRLAAFLAGGGIGAIFAPLRLSSGVIARPVAGDAAQMPSPSC
jgi:hypothetical protein